MDFINTRNRKESLQASQAILQGLATNGGLFVPQEIPLSKISDMSKMSYVDHALWVLQQYFTDFTADELRECVENAYNTSNFDTPAICPVKTFADVSFLELFHGRTLAFKDMALSLLPHLISTALKKTQNPKKQVILTATSGDTGIATMEGFKNIDGMTVIVFYPENGVSFAQKMQMTTHDGKNTVAIGVRGNFDDAQSEVKRIFLDAEMRAKLDAHNHVFSSANSINIGRLIPQVAYYFYAYAQLVAGGMPQGEAVSFVVPTGNFGNILAGYYAKKMGLPVHRLICASNENNVLYEFFNTGVLDSNRELVLTSSPSMDILLPSNFERLVFDLHQNEDAVVKMAKDGRYENNHIPGFVGYDASEIEVSQAIKSAYNKHGYLIDPHTAVAYVANEKYDGKEKRVIVSTASPYKFAKTVMTSLDKQFADVDEIDLIEQMAAQKNENIPPQIANLRERDVRHKTVVDIGSMKDTVLKVLGLNRV